MKSFYLTSLALALGLVSMAGVANAQGGYGSSSLLPMPQANYRYPTAQASAAVPQAAPPGGWNQFYSGSTPPAAAQPASPSDQLEAIPQGTPDYDHIYDAGGGSCTNDFADAMSSSWPGSCDVGCDTCCKGAWFGGAAGLVMGRTRGNPYYFSYFDSNEAGQLLRPGDQWAGGAQAWVGKWFCCGQFGVEGVYWGLYPGTSTQTLLGSAAPGNLNGILNFDQLTYNGFTADNFVNAAMAHRLQTTYQFHNAEINFLGGTGPYVPGLSRFTWLGGFRYINFSDTLQFASDPTDTTFNGNVNELYYDVNTNNNLYGLQLGGRGDVYLSQRFALNFGSKFGVLANNITSHQRIGGAAGDAVINNGPYNGQAFNINSTTNTVSFLGEVNAGASYWLTNNWRILGGYRAVALSGVAVATQQIPMDLRGINDVHAIDSGNSLILHGAYAGAEFTW